MKAKSVEEHRRQDVAEKCRFAEAVLDASAGGGVIAYDHDLKILYWSGALEPIIDLNAYDALGMRIDDAVPFLRDAFRMTQIRAALAGEKQTFVGHYVRERDGGDGFFDATLMPLRGAGKDVTAGLVLLRDTTQRRTSEQNLRETELRFRSMADASPVLLWMAGTDSMCTFFNQTWLEFTGRTLDQEWGVGWAEGIHFEDFQRCIDTYMTAFSAREPFEMEYRLLRKDGEYRWILDRGVPRWAADKMFAGFIGSCVDITDIKRLEAELRKAVREREDFLAIASHELRTPLTTLQLQIEILQRALRSGSEGVPLSGRLERSVTAAAQQVRRLETLIEELLDVSRLTSKKVELVASVVDIVPLVRGILDRLSVAAARASCPVTLKTVKSACAVVDPARFDRIVTNVLVNAFKYGAGAPVIVTVELGDGQVRVIVKDEGPGIAPANQKRIFERFERAVSTANYGGFGLGLWIARELTVAHGGSIGVESELGKGAAFTVVLPL